MPNLKSLVKSYKLDRDGNFEVTMAAGNVRTTLTPENFSGWLCKKKVPVPADVTAAIAAKAEREQAKRFSELQQAPVRTVTKILKEQSKPPAIERKKTKPVEKKVELWPAGRESLSEDESDQKTTASGKKVSPPPAAKVVETQPAAKEPSPKKPASSGKKKKKKLIRRRKKDAVQSPKKESPVKAKPRENNLE